MGAIAKAEKGGRPALDRWADFLDRVITPASRMINGIGSAAILGMVLLMAVHVILRYVLARPIKGTVELEEFMLVIVVFLGLAYTAVEKKHVRIEFLISRFSRLSRAVINSVTAIASLALCVLMTWRTAVYALTNWHHKTASVLLNVPVSIFITVVMIGCAMLSLVLLSEFFRAFSEVLTRTRGIVAFLAVLFCISGTAYILRNMALSANATAMLGLGLLLLLMAFRMMIAFAMMLVGFLGMTTISGLNAGFHLMATVPYTTTATYHLCVIPFFVLMGHLCAVAGISRDLYNTAYKWMGHFRGGLSVGTIGGCAGFAAVSGDSMGTAAVMGAAALPEMKRYRYNDALATGCVAAGGTLGILIPPSMGFIIYAIITDTSISRLFIAGILPGLLLTFLFMAVVYLRTHLHPEIAPPAQRSGWAEKLLSLKDTWGMILIFLVVIGGIYRGVFTPTEAGAIGAAGALVIGLAKRQFTVRKLVAALLDTGRTVSMLFLLLIGAHILGYFLAGSEAPHQVSNFVTNLPLNKS